MKLDISDVLKKETAQKEIHLELDESSCFDGRETIKFLQPIKFDGILDKVDDSITLTGTVTALLEFACSRCIEKFNYVVDLNIEEKLANYDEANKDDDVVFIDSDTIDITEIIQNNIIGTLPIKRLCREDCKGLCQQCGVNLNFSACNCMKNMIDPRLAKLKDMFLTD